MNQTVRPLPLTTRQLGGMAMQGGALAVLVLAAAVWEVTAHTWTRLANEGPPERLLAPWYMAVLLALMVAHEVAHCVAMPRFWQPGRGRFGQAWRQGLVVYYQPLVPLPRNRYLAMALAPFAALTVELSGLAWVWPEYAVDIALITSVNASMSTGDLYIAWKAWRHARADEHIGYLDGEYLALSGCGTAPGTIDEAVQGAARTPSAPGAPQA